MKRWVILLMPFFLSACAHLIDSKEQPQRYEEKLTGEHSALARCVTHKLQSDGRAFMRFLQFRNRQYPEGHTSEIDAVDSRYVPHMIATYSPSNPDAVLIYGDSNPEMMPYAERSKHSGSADAFTLMLRQIDHTTVHATLKGEKYLGDIAWKILQTCVASEAKP